MTFLHRSPGVRYSLLKPEDLEEMALLLAESFSCDEPMARAVGLSREEIREIVLPLGRRAVDERLTILARATDSGELIGAMLTNDFGTPPPEEFERLSEKFVPIAALLEGLDEDYRLGKNIRPGEYLHLFMIAVSQAARGKKIAQTLVEVCLRNGVERGYCTAVTEATGLISQRIFRNLGFADCLTVRYRDYTYQGARVFETIQGPAGTILMEKSLPGVVLAK